jgi:hypothetical protein
LHFQKDSKISSHSPIVNRGSYNFKIEESGLLIDSIENLERFRKLFRDATIIGGNWGPGDEGDFDHGSWHILCHLAAGSAILDTTLGRAWCGITHSPDHDKYQATITFRHNEAVRTIPLMSGEGLALAHGAHCFGFLEGSSIGHIAARGVNDSPDAFNGWPRQRFDKDVTSEEDGGTVWEHWATTRDIRPTSVIGNSVLEAYLTLVSCLGGRFVAAVARGRREHSHPEQLVALVRAGFLSVDEALWDVVPEPIPIAAQRLLYEARPKDALAASELLHSAINRQHYFMFERRIGKWSKTDEVKKDLEA